MGALLTQFGTWLQGLVVWLVGELWSLALGFLGAVVGMFASISGQEAAAPGLMSQMQQYANYANAWVPLDVGLAFVVAYYTLVLIPVKVVRVVKSFVPTLG